MAIPLIFAAIILFAAAYQNNLQYLMTQLEKDIGGYFVWLIALLAIAAIGLYRKARPISIALLTLVILVIILKNGGIFTNIANMQGTNWIVPAPPGDVVSKPDIAPGSSGGVEKTGEQVTPNQNPGGSSGGGSGGAGSGSLFGIPTPTFGGPTSIFGKMFGR